MVYTYLVDDDGSVFSLPDFLNIIRLCAWMCTIHWYQDTRSLAHVTLKWTCMCIVRQVACERSVIHDSFAMFVSLSLSLSSSSFLQCLFCFGKITMDEWAGRKNRSLNGKREGNIMFCHGFYYCFTCHEQTLKCFLPWLHDKLYLRTKEGIQRFITYNKEIIISIDVHV